MQDASLVFSSSFEGPLIRANRRLVAVYCVSFNGHAVRLLLLNDGLVVHRRTLSPQADTPTAEFLPLASFSTEAAPPKELLLQEEARVRSFEFRTTVESMEVTGKKNS